MISDDKRARLIVVQYRISISNIAICPLTNEPRVNQYKSYGLILVGVISVGAGSGRENVEHRDCTLKMGLYWRYRVNNKA